MFGDSTSLIGNDVNLFRFEWKWNLWILRWMTLKWMLRNIKALSNNKFDYKQPSAQSLDQSPRVPETQNEDIHSKPCCCWPCSYPGQAPGYPQWHLQPTDKCIWWRQHWRSWWLWKCSIWSHSKIWCKTKNKKNKHFTYDGYVKLNQPLFAQLFGLNPICHYQGYEERFYPSRLWVCTRSSSNNGGFMKLFRYISGANARSEINTVRYYILL